MANDFSNDSNCKALWSMLSGALTTDSVGSNTLTNYDSVQECITDYRTGGCCADFEADDTQCLYVNDTDLDADFPTKNGDTTPKISICFWHKPESQDAVNKFVLAKGIWGEPSWRIRLDFGNNINFLKGNAPSSTEQVLTNLQLEVDKWYHIAITYDDSDKSYFIKVWDNYANQQVGNTYSGNFTNNIYVNTQPVVIGATNATGLISCDGLIDEVVIFDDILTETEIDQIRAGTYGAVADFESESEKFANEPFSLLKIELDGGDEHFAKVDVVDSDFYEGMVLNSNSVTRSLSHEDGTFEISDIDIRLSNATLYFSENFYYKTLINRKAGFRFGFESMAIADFLAFYTGAISSFSYSQEEFKLRIKDASQPYLTATGYAPLIKLSDWANVSEYVVGLRMQIIYGEVSKTDSGACPLYQIDTDKWLCAGHACKSVDSVYVDSVLKTLTTHYTVATAEIFADGLSGKICTITFTAGNIPSATAEVNANIKGIEDAGDGSGTLISNNIEQIEHFIDEYVELPAALKSASHFASATTICTDRGYSGAGMILDDEAIRDVLAKMILSCEGELWHNTAGEFSVSIFDPSIVDSARLYSDQDDILTGSFSVTPQVDLLANQVVANYDYDYVEDFYLNQATDSDATAITDAAKTYEKEIDLDFCRDSDIAADIISRYLFRYKYPVQRARFKTTLRGLNNDLADAIKLTHFAGLGILGVSGGADERLFRIKKFDIDIDGLEVTIEADDIDRYIRNIFVFGADADIGADTWLTATESEKQYGFLCDRTTGEYSNGNDGKTFW